MLSAKYPTRYRRKLISSFTREPEVSIARNDLADNFFRGRCVGLFGHDAGSGVSGKSSGIDLAVETGSACPVSGDRSRRVDRGVGTRACSAIVFTNKFGALPM